MLLIYLPSGRNKVDDFFVSRAENGKTAYRQDLVTSSKPGPESLRIRFDARDKVAEAVLNSTSDREPEAHEVLGSLEDDDPGCFGQRFGHGGAGDFGRHAGRLKWQLYLKVKKVCKY